MAALSSNAQEVVVYGATPSGIASAVTAARAGHSTLLLEPTEHIGGLLTGGLSFTDFRTQESITGFFREYMNRVLAHYRKTYGENSQQAKDCFQGAHAEPKVSQAIIDEMLRSEKLLTVRRGWRLAGAETNSRIEAIRSAAGERIAAKFFIDATYEGDLAGAARVPYRLGRESAKEYGERFAGRLYFKDGVVLPGSTGEGDSQVQSYNFRILMTTDPGNRIPVSKPANYDRREYAHSIPYFHNGRLKHAFSVNNFDGVLRIQWLPNRKADINDIKGSPLRLVLPGETNKWPEGDAAERARIFERHKNYALGLLWFLNHDEELPAAIRAEAREWGFAKDEFAGNGHFPPALYIREARRVEGVYTFLERDTQPRTGVRSPLHTDSIAIGDYSLNSHGHGKPPALHPTVSDGDFAQPTVPFQIPYGTIVPVQVSNLLVPVALSASHVGYSALRLEPVWTALGHAAGHAAHLALQADTGAAKVSVPELQKRLLADRAALIYTSDVAPDSPAFDAVQRMGLQGFLHDIAEVHPAELGVLKQWHAQYAFPFPHHALEPDAPLDATLLARWRQRLTPAQQYLAPEGQTTRGKFLAAIARE